MKAGWETQRRVDDAFGYIGLGMFDAASAELDGLAVEEPWLPPVRSAQAGRLAWQATSVTVVNDGAVGERLPSLYTRLVQTLSDADPRYAVIFVWAGPHAVTRTRKHP